MTSCVSGAVKNSCAAGTPAASDATCNGVDDDCSGAVDEDYAPVSTTCGVGACAAVGATSCVNGTVVDDCVAGSPAQSDVTCDGIDDDCDGAVDFAGCALPPEPATVAPVIDASAGTPFYELFSFFFEGANPIQRSAVISAFDPDHVGVVHGHVRMSGGAAAPGVLVSVPSHPEYGTTRSRADGDFDLLVEGGGELLLRFDLLGYARVDRVAFPPWRGSDVVDDVVMTPRASVATYIDTSGSATGYQVARGASQADRDGARQVTVLVAPGTEAQIIRPNGSLTPLPSLNLRVTELTVGADGSHAMPGPLPGASAYMFAVELTADEEIVSGVQAADERAILSQPARLYVENFLGLQIGRASCRERV